MRVPRSDKVKEAIRLRKVDGIIGNYGGHHNLMSRNH